MKLKGIYFQFSILVILIVCVSYIKLYRKYHQYRMADQECEREIEKTLDSLKIPFNYRD